MKSDYVSIKSKLQKLEQIDPERQLFGSNLHDYKLNAPISTSEIISFETQYGVTLPEDYREFLLSVGNGGAGPYYGLQTLRDSLYIDLDYKRENEYLDPSKKFMITESWNMKYRESFDDEAAYSLFEAEYFDNKWVNGLLRICNFGCGVSMNLVVNGSEYGTIWVDDRSSDGGIYPDTSVQEEARIGFMDWYKAWLENSLVELVN